MKMELGGVMKLLPLMMVIPMLKSMFGGKGGSGLGSMMNIIMMMSVMPLVLNLVGGLGGTA
jgi:hypothetical protein